MSFMQCIISKFQNAINNVFCFVLLYCNMDQCSRYPLATSPMAIIWPIGRLKLVSGEIFDYKLQPKINVTDALFPRINS